MNDVLKRDGPGPDFILEEGEDCVWIAVDNIAVYVRRTDEGVAVSLYPKARVLDDELAGTWALFSEAEDDEDDNPPDTE